MPSTLLRLPSVEPRTLFFTSTVAVSAWIFCSIAVAADSKVFATQGPVRATQAEVAAGMHVFSLVAADEPGQVQVLSKQIAEEILRYKTLEQSAERNRFNDALSKGYVEHQSRTAILRAQLELRERAALKRVDENPKLAEARARELFLAAGARAASPPSANVTVLHIDSFKRGYSDSLIRYNAVRAKLAVPGADFELVAKEFSDDQGLASGKSTVTFDVARNQAPGGLGRAVFDTLKIGEISEPLATVEGWLLVRVNQRVTPPAPTFEETAEKWRNEVRLEATRIAREEFARLLSTHPIVYADDEGSPAKGNTAAPQQVKKP
jgi:parvulin-like peptidyl-prolyl isomerase